MTTHRRFDDAVTYARERARREGRPFQVFHTRMCFYVRPEADEVPEDGRRDGIVQPDGTWVEHATTIERLYAPRGHD